ncbi:SIS domain-containing protein [Ligilactobacillus pobuzihii]|uniref:SIS domain-containing protein n=1 Tax=Ligilactobacillus pobuzihii TaxID=449659 RepID=A0A0R2LHS6_9LACO|nr:SIS domain-containing protein [Ligilactobacillus pobuzihii]KRK09498.1 hypothetical protein FD11_GL000732 [Ligilactobacillus pobuzihii E100301 = KCTC 13174]KRO01304.1 hypothetical protein IV66_GL000492 [Ligilactobacillus pobuzihii]GEN48891.1 glucosamine--fructose-6-phosphate aminotransferase [Ligilactobacillus pobuzihii]
MTKPTMLDYINETKAILLDMLNKRNETYNEFADVYTANVGKYKNIYLIGSGTSFNSCITAQPFLEKILNKHVVIINSYNFAHYEELVTSNDLVIAITQEGESTNTIAALNRANNLNCDNFVITEDRDNSCSKVAQHKIVLACGLEHIGPKTKGYSASILTFYLIALEAAKTAKVITAEAYSNYISRIERVVDNLDNIIEETKSWFDLNKEDLEKCDHGYILGYGINKGTIIEGALKSLETVREYFQPFELEEFLHGPIASMHDNTYTIIIAPRTYGYERARKLYESLDSQNAHSYLVSGRQETNADHVLNGSFISDEDFNPLEYCIPLQLFAYLLYTSQGKDLEVRNYPDTKEALTTKAKDVQ